ncbi:MAG: ChbG/HpnK family deacetylase [Gammaproteobacteria bacterium]|nr:ChbG/HpnK family deacetylase [Gammaproteobacteria bacterium]
MLTTARVVAICADDYGLAPGISNAILDLVQQRRLTSVSCITNSADFSRAATQLRPWRDQIEIGLHFNLTEGSPLQPALTQRWPRLPSIGQLIVATHTGLIPRSAVADELQAQLQAFRCGFDRDPDFIDGHQHVHDLPGIRRLIIAAASAAANRPWVRNTGKITGPGYNFKRRVIEFTGGRALHRQLQQQTIPCNTVLAGVYDFTPSHYRGLMQSWLARLPATGGLIFCHPGLPPESTTPQGMAYCRANEWKYFSSEEFTADLHQARVLLLPLRPQQR